MTDDVRKLFMAVLSALLSLVLIWAVDPNLSVLTLILAMGLLVRLEDEDLGGRTYWREVWLRQAFAALVFVVSISLIALVMSR